MHYFLRNFKLYVLGFVLLGMSHSVYSQKNAVQITPYSFTQLQQELAPSIKSSKKPIVVFMHAPWCNFCEGLKNTTFKNKKVITKLNADFHFISFNAETKQDIVFKNQTYSYLPTGKHTGQHELASAIAGKNNPISYPILVFLNPELQIVFRYNSWISSKNFLELLTQISSKL